MYLADSLSSLICVSVLERALRMCTLLCVCVCVVWRMRARGPEVAIGDDCRLPRRRPFCGSWRLDHATVFESRPLAAV